MDDQGTGGIESRGIESNTTRRLSEARPPTHDEKLQQEDSQPDSSNTEGGEQVKFPVQSGPRLLATPGPSLSRNPSTSSNFPRVQSTRNRSDLEQSRSVTRPNKPLDPPVTKGTLSELDVTKIIHNPKLRHDINFDPELHFRPNTDGEKGKRKQEKAGLFWKALSDQLKLFLTNRDGFMSRYGQGEEWCLPLLLKSVKEIIQTLVPSKDRVYLDEGLNVDLIMQQFGRGMADLEKLASWLSGVLKSHCAPMRDEWVDEMYSQLTNGNRDNDMDLLVAGMRNLLSVLEAMKLDVANHQIRCLRPILIEDTVHFEQRFFLKKIRDGKLDPMPAREWYSDMARRYGDSPSASNQAFGEMGVFIEALSRMVFPSHPDTFPDTLIFDEERMLKLRSDMLDTINLEICMRLYEDYENSASNSQSSLFSHRLPADPSDFLRSAFEDDGQEFNFAAPRSRPSSLVLSASGSAQSSPRSSLITLAPEPTPSSGNRAENRRSKARDLYNSLVSLLQSTPTSLTPHQRWLEMKDSLALQIFRFTNAPTESLMHFEDRLNAHISDRRSPLFQSVEQHFHRRLLTELQPRMKEFKGLTGVGLFSVATGGRLHGPGRTWDGSRDSLPDRDRNTPESSVREAREEGGIEDMATRLGHLATLHWRVWAQLVYLRDVDTEMSNGDEPAGYV
ncbi:Protein SOSEKI 1 [Diatrype stigma]|uniref:Protein SOSEKI 1 n=1 Tax=Diatrype stigma TaxID=117547 RepID=A0AAN9YSH2_9PEZI